MLKRPRSVSPKVSSKSLPHPLSKRVCIESQLVSACSETFTIGHPTVATLDQNADISGVEMWEALRTPMDLDTEFSEMDEEVDQLCEESQDEMEEQSPNQYSGKTKPQNNLEMGDNNNHQLLLSPAVHVPRFIQATSAPLPRTPQVSRSISRKHNFTPIKTKRTRHKFNFRPLPTSPTPTPVMENLLGSTEPITTEFAGASPLSSSNPSFSIKVEKKNLGSNGNMISIKPSAERRNRCGIWNESEADGDIESQESESDDDGDNDIHNGNDSDGSNDGGSWVTAARWYDLIFPSNFVTKSDASDDPERHKLQYCHEATIDFTRIAAPNARGESIEFVNRGDNTIAPTPVLIFDVSEGETEVVCGLKGGNANDAMAGSHGEIAGPSALIDDTYANAVAMCETPSTPRQELQIRDVLHASGEELMLSENFSEKEEMEVIDYLTGMGADGKADVAMAISDGGMCASQAQASNLPFVISNPPGTTWVINHRGEEIEVEAHGIDNVDEGDDSGSNEDMATSPHLSLDAAPTCSAILSIPALVFPLEVNEATVVFSKASQEDSRAGTPDRLVENIAPWAKVSQKLTTNNRGEELELIDVDVNNEGDDFASAHDMAALVFPHVDDSTVVFDVGHIAGYQHHKLQTNKGTINNLVQIAPSGE